MIRMSLSSVATLLGLSPIMNEMEFHGISFDSRTLEPDNLFVAIRGESLDGHAFVTHAQKAGAKAAIVDHPVACDLPQLVVPDTTKALGSLAKHWRDQFTLPIIGVTGSNGKTTLKNMIASILSAACQDKNAVLATKGNLNNYWGLPKTLAQLNANHRYAVIEMGMNHFGEIEYLTKLTKPQVAVINNAGMAHVEGLGSIEGVARAKGEIFLGLDKNGTAILNRDDAFYEFWRNQIGNQAHLSFSLHSDADVRTDLSTTSDGVIISTPQGDVTVKLPLLGKHNILNALAATATVLPLHIPLAAIKTGLEEMSSAPGRLQLHALANGVKIIDDTYNANPFSLLAAVETLCDFTGKKILVLGDMKELGPNAKSIHTDIGQKIRAAGIDYLFTFGELSESTAQSFGEGAYHFNEQEKLVNALKPFLYNQTTILVKGSRSMRMEKVVNGLMQ